MKAKKKEWIRWSKQNMGELSGVDLTIEEALAEAKERWEKSGRTTDKPCMIHISSMVISMVPIVVRRYLGDISARTEWVVKGGDEHLFLVKREKPYPIFADYSALDSWALHVEQSGSLREFSMMEINQGLELGGRFLGLRKRGNHIGLLPVGFPLHFRFVDTARGMPETPPILAGGSGDLSRDLSDFFGITMAEMEHLCVPGKQLPGKYGGIPLVDGMNENGVAFHIRDFIKRKISASKGDHAGALADAAMVVEQAIQKVWNVFEHLDK